MEQSAGFERFLPVKFRCRTDSENIITVAENIVERSGRNGFGDRVIGIGEAVEYTSDQCFVRLTGTLHYGESFLNNIVQVIQERKRTAHAAACFRNVLLIINLLVESNGFHERQKPCLYGIHLVGRRGSDIVSAVADTGKTIHCGMVIVQCQSELFEIVGALHSSGGFSCGLDGGQEQADQDADDGDDDQKFDEGESRWGFLCRR